MAGRTYGRTTIRRYGRAAILVSVPLLLGSCVGRGPAAPAGAAARTGTAAGAGQLRITQVRVGNSVPIEGGFSYIRLERAAGGTVTERRLPDSGKLTLTVPPGAYRLVNWQRFCDANCGNLDPPSNQCARPFTLRKGEKLQAVIRVDYASRSVIVLHH